MISMKKILFPTDFSECADAALAWAMMLARSFDAELIMFHAVVLHGDDVGDEFYSRFPDLDKLTQVLLSNADSRLVKAIEDLGKITVRRKVRRGISAPDEIIDFARDEAVDLIAMGTHGRRGLRHLILGSVAERVLRHADCPVPTVKKAAKPMHDVVRLQKIVLPVDFSEANKQAVRYACALAGALDAEIEVVHVFEQSVHPSFYAIGKKSLMEVDPGLESRAELAINEFMQEIGADTKFTYTLVEGSPAEEIAKAAAKNRDAMIVIGSHGAGALERLVVGSTTEKVLRLAECPVLVTKPGD